MHTKLISIGCLLMAGLGACAPEPEAVPASLVNEMDPYLARALNDPLMVDPDLAYRSEANAAITLGYDHALPSFKGSEEAASRARETARLALLEEGPIPEFPLAQSEPGPAALAERFGVGAVLEVVDAPPACRKGVAGSFALAARMPDLAAIMPHGMVRVAAAVEKPDCTMRLVRYVSPAAIEDILLHHNTLATRAGLEPRYFTQPESSLIADRRGTHLHVYARATSGDLNAVDVITWTR
ncbi:MAG: hypothetical protein AAFZ11_12885 [Pseudomonadota bacterium]